MSSLIIKFDTNKYRIMNNSCPVCNQEKVGKKKFQIYCSMKCRDIARHQKALTICIICGNSFIKSNSNAKACSRQCADISRHKSKEKVCPNCGVIFQGFGKTCSHSCGAILMRRRNKLNFEKHKIFCEKVNKNQKHIWATRDNIAIRKQIGQTIHRNNNKLTKEELRKKFNYNPMGNPEICYQNIKSGKAGFVSNYKGIFRPKNPQKYKGNLTNICYRSKWEFKLMSRLDLSNDVEWWSSEEVFLSYRNPAKGRIARYFPDIVCKYKNNPFVQMIEIKPYKETVQPIPSKNLRRWKKEAITYGVNKAKWIAAEEYCKQRGWQFHILTEMEAPWLKL